MSQTTELPLKGKTALITGSTSGIGLAIAKEYCTQGASVIVNSRNESSVTAALAELDSEGFSAHGCVFDVTKKADIHEAIGKTEAELGPIDILVNNAGLQQRVPLLECDEETWRRVLDVNLTGAFLVTQCVARGMVERRSGKVVNICSLMSEVARPTIAPYTAAKGGLKMLTRAMAIEWAPYQVQVNGIGPGYFATKMNTALVEDETFNNWICGRTPAGRWGQVNELTGAAVFLASAASNFVTGQILYVDGGVLAAL